MRRNSIRAAVVVALALAAVALPGAARAATPGNDDFANAAVINPSALPFSDSVDTTSATTETGEPGGGCFYSGPTVWYSITPSSDGVFRVDTSTSNYTNAINIYTGSNLNALSFAGCGYSFQQPTFRATSGTTYYVQVGGYFSSGQLQLTLSQVPSPPNDAFANASPIAPSSLPFSDSQSGLAATLEPGEPTASCNVFGVPNNSWWYSFTPSSSRSYKISTYSGGLPTVAVYTGSPGSLSEAACRTLGGSNAFSFAATQGVTYYIQLGDYYGGAFGGVNFTLDVAPNPVANFFFAPGDPSPYDSVQFYDNSNDPGGNGLTSEVWSFGDGTTLTNPGSFPTHRFPRDGDYSVKLTVTTTDGRTASQSQIVYVRTHDVTITKVTTPQTASVGQTRQITVGLTNSRYPETVQVQLYKSVAGGGWQLVGNSTQSVPVRGANRTTSFVFNYTFAPEDKTLGKVTFQAVATIQGARDAIPTDNTFISLPTKVN